MPDTRVFNRATIGKDLIAGTVVFFVALPLCLGVALACGAPLMSGLVSGIVGGLLIGILSGSQFSVSGPAAGLTAIIAAQISSLGGSFQAFLASVIIAGVVQILLGMVRAGGISAFVPSGVINGLLAAIGVILILKQIPHLLGHDSDPEGEMSFQQPDNETTLSEFGELWSDIHPGAACIGVLALVILKCWDFFPALKRLLVPAPLIVVITGILLKAVLDWTGGTWMIEASHLVQVPVVSTFQEFRLLVVFPDWSQFSNPAVYFGGLTLALVASLETLLNLEAVDKLSGRLSPPNRELVAQGCGNILSGLLGGLPMTSVIVRSSVNINAGGRTRLSAIVHGMLLLISVVGFPRLINFIPLSCLAAILLHTGLKLASPELIRRMWIQGRYQFIPFAMTVLAIVFTDLLIGVLIGLAIHVGFLLNSNLRRPVRCILEKHITGDLYRIEFPEQVSFLNRAGVEKTLHQIPRGGHLLIDAHNSDYIDPDILILIRDFCENTAVNRGIQVNVVGFRSEYQLHDMLQFVDYSTRDVQQRMTPMQVLQMLQDGNSRFRGGQRLTRDLGRQINATSEGQHPLAVILSCIDSRAPAELIFDTGIGDILNVRVAGNVTSPKVLGSIEYSCAVAGARLVLVMGHTRCGAVNAAVSQLYSRQSVAEATGCGNLEPILADIQQSIRNQGKALPDQMKSEEQQQIADEVSERNVEWSVRQILSGSPTISRLADSGTIAVVGGIYDVASGIFRLLPNASHGLHAPSQGPSNSG